MHKGSWRIVRIFLEPSTAAHYIVSSFRFSRSGAGVNITELEERSARHPATKPCLVSKHSIEASMLLIHLGLTRKMMVTRMLRVRVADVAVLKRRNKTTIGLVQR
ncbi:hypothetical protein CB0940_07534 [Cercospora beticola]|uniref:Uncharacterized protein n=1 Tax=Cercospora beticola TaxID=122368 RepID=A0A2G5H8J5_CERBT|nr:hypothetical protein CB0940_07534 [Cercospora beticola]PIA88858.1 hypothetical protein CB0940_07534 [Cercospora beticola]